MKLICPLRTQRMMKIKGDKNVLPIDRRDFLTPQNVFANETFMSHGSQRMMKIETKTGVSPVRKVFSSEINNKRGKLCLNSIHHDGG